MSIQRPRRSVTRQPWLSTNVAVNASNPVPLTQNFQQGNLSSLYTAFIISVPSNSGVRVAMADSTVSLSPLKGIEILPGAPRTIAIQQTRQLYELQLPIVTMLPPDCQVLDGIPVVAFDLTQFYLIGSGSVVCGVMLFAEGFV